MSTNDAADRILARIFDQQDISQDAIDYYYTTTN